METVESCWKSQPASGQPWVLSVVVATTLIREKGEGGRSGPSSRPTSMAGKRQLIKKGYTVVGTIYSTQFSSIFSPREIVQTPV